METDPPSYASSSASSTALAESNEAPFLVNLVPSAPGTSLVGGLLPSSTSSSAAGAGLGGRSDGVSFQFGALGAGPSSLQGEVQLKLLAEADSVAPPITKVEVVFRGVERGCSLDFGRRGRRRRSVERGRTDRSEEEQASSSRTEIELVESKVVVWEPPSPSNTSPRVSTPPAVMPFKIDLTPDLPHCVHLGGGGLEYELEARVHCDGHVASTGTAGGSSSFVSVKAPVHLTRYSKRGEALVPPTLPMEDGDADSQRTPTLGRSQISAVSPTPISVTVSKTLLRRGEPVGLKVRIPPPAQELVQDKGLRLRSVSAELRRCIRVRRLEDAPTDNQEEDDETSTVVEEGEVTMAVEAPPYQYDPDAITEAPPALEADDPSTSSAPSEGKARLPSPEPLDDGVIAEQTTVLAFSGKSCRFSPSRTVVLHLALYPSQSVSAPSALAAAELANTSPSRPHTLGGELARRKPNAITATTTDCESITQTTILHDVGFSVVVTVQVVGRGGERHDVVLERQLGVVPDWAPLPEKAREAESLGDGEVVSGQDGRIGFAGPRSAAAGLVAAGFVDDELASAPAPLYAEMDFEDAARAASTSASARLWAGHPPWEGTSRSTDPAEASDDDDEEEEYDGYEDFSTLAGTSGPAPPTIDEDEPPPPAPENPPEGMDLSVGHLPQTTRFREEEEDDASSDERSSDSSPVLTANEDPTEHRFAFVPLDRFASTSQPGHLTPPPPASPPPLLDDHPSDEVLSPEHHRHPHHHHHLSPPAYAGWNTPVDVDDDRSAPPPISPVDHTDLSHPSTATPASSEREDRAANQGPAPPPPYAAEFGVLPPGMIGVARADNGEIGGFLVRR